MILGGLLALFSQPVQYRILARLVDPRAEDVFTVEHARVGLTRTYIRGLNLQRPDLGYRVGELEADLSVWDIYFRQHVKIGDIRASDIEFDYTRFAEVPRPEDPDPLDGLLGELDVPVKLSIGEAMVEGRVLLPGAGEAPLTTSFRMTGGGLEPGGEGNFILTAFIEDPNADGWLRELEGRGEIALKQTAKGSFERLEATTHLHVHGLAIPQEELLAHITMLRTAKGEEYGATLHRIAAGEEPMRLLEIDATFTSDDRIFRGDWGAWAAEGQVGGFLYVERLPEFSGEGNGRFSFDSQNNSVALAGGFRAETGELDVLAAEMRGLGGIVAETTFAFRRDEEWLHLEDLTVEVTSAASGSALLTAQSGSPFRYHRESGRIEAPEQGATLMELSITGAPIEWAGLFRSAEEEQPVLFGGEVIGTFRIGAFEGGLLAETVAPLVANPVSVSLGGQMLLKDAGLLLNGAVSWVDGNVGARLEPLEFTIADRAAVVLRGRFSQLEEIVEGRLHADLPVVLNQPGPGMKNLTSGTIDAEARGGFRSGVRGSLVFAEGQIAEADERMAPVYLDFLVERDGEHSWQFSFPVRIDRDDLPSSFTLAGRTVLSNGEKQLKMELRGEHFFWENVTQWAEAFARPDAEPPEREVHEIPFWRDWAAALTVHFDSIQFSDGYDVGPIDAQVATEADGIEAMMNTVFLGSEVQANARLEFLEGGTHPYRMTGNLRVPQADISALFQAMEPDRPPMVDGSFAVASRFSSAAGHPAGLIAQLQGNAQLSSDGGALRLFYSDNLLVQLGIGIAGLLGGIGGELGTIGEIAEEFTMIPYDLMNVTLERTSDQSLLIKDLRVVGPEFHLRGEGVREQREEREEAYTKFQVQLAARGELEELLGRAGVLSDERDDLGYRLVRTPITIEGEAGDTEVDPLISVIIGAVLELAAPIPGRATEERERAAPPLDVDGGPVAKGQRR